MDRMNLQMTGTISSWDFWKEPLQGTVEWTMILILAFFGRQVFKYRVQVVTVAKSRKLWKGAYLVFVYLTAILCGLVLRWPAASNWFRLIAWINICLSGLFALFDLMVDFLTISLLGLERVVHFTPLLSS